MTTTRSALLVSAAQTLSVTSPSSRLDAEILLCFALDIDRIQLISRPEATVSADEATRFESFIQRRLCYEPVAYITGVKEFYGFEFQVSPGVLIPRPETEQIVEEVLKVAETAKGTFRLLDLGTGSGCILIAVARTLANRGKRCVGLGVDISREAIEVAQRNAQLHELSESLGFVQSSWCDALSNRVSWHCIVSNPPYVQSNAELARDLSFEPSSALFAGSDGLDAYRKLIPEVAARIGADGIFVAEIGHGQGDPLSEIWRKSSGRSPEVFKDLAGLERLFLVS